MNKPAPRSPSSQVWRHVSAGTTLALTILFWIGIGWWIDRKWQCSPWGILIGAALGIAVGLYGFIKEFLSDTPDSPSSPQ